MNAMDTPTEDGYLSSPASTPDTTFDEERFLVTPFKPAKPPGAVEKTKWYDFKYVPVAIVAVSILQVTVMVILGV